MFPHKVLENRFNGQQAIKLLDDTYSGMIVVYSKVEFDEDIDTLHMKFEYNIIDDGGVVYDKEELEQYLGECLEQLLCHGIENNNITYSGGT